jgi:hypothetical protein
MSQENVKKQELFDELPPDFPEKSRRLISDVFSLITDQTQRIANDIAEFNQKRIETRERIKRGARRTSGRVV